MQTLTVRRKIYFPPCGLWKWKSSDYGEPLTVGTSNSKALIYAEEDEYFIKKGESINSFPSGRIELLFSPPPPKLVEGLKKEKGQISQDAAQIIYDNYSEAFQHFQALLMSAGGVIMLGTWGQEDIRSFFSSTPLPSEKVEWRIDDEKYTAFRFKFPRGKGRNPIYTAAQLVTPQRWRKMQRVSDDGEIPRGEILELYKIRAKAAWRELRIAAIEASIISETLLRDYAFKILRAGGFSNNKIKNMKNDLTFNHLLNIVLPLSLNKTELRRIHPSIQAVDTLRSIRNDLVHGNKTVDEIDQIDVTRGIDGAIKLVRFLSDKLETD